MRNKTCKIMISIALIITLTAINFIFVGANAVTYAVDAIAQKKATSHKNIEFMAYFKEGENQVSEYGAKANATDLMLYLQIAVKQEGYFNGKVSLQNSNFKFKTNSEDERINNITENSIELNQITAGETVEIPVGIEFLTDTNFDVSLLSMESKLKLEGTYTYGKRPDTAKVTGTRTVTLQMTSPYDEENKGIVLNQSVLTNKVFQYEASQNRVIQLQIEAGMENNLYPIKTEKVELQAPTLQGKYPINVSVQSPEQLVTNGKTLEEGNYTYDKTTGKLTITIENEEQQGKVVWEKSGTDKYIVTYVYEGTESIEEQTIVANAEISLYDSNKTVAKFNRKTTLSSEEIDSVIEVSLNNTENEIYKGTIYEGIERTIEQEMDIQVNLAGVAEGIKIQENNANTNVSNIQTKSIKVNLNNLKDILGEEGNISIKNQATGAIIAQISATTGADENQNVAIEMPVGIGAITVETTKPVKAGILKIETTKLIPAQNRQAMQNVTEINFALHTSYMLGQIENTVSDATATVKLQETQTHASLSVSKTEFSTMRTNENVEIRAVLHSNNEKYELYKNPHITLTLPQEFENIEVTSINLINEDEMVIGPVGQRGNVIEIQLQGEQTKYKGIAIDGATILITANLTTNKKQKNADTAFTMQYTNEKAMHYAEGANIGTEVVNTKIVSYAGLITTNAIEQYGIETINNEGNKSGELELATGAKTATVSAQIINNDETVMKDVTILGTFPTEKAMEENNIEVEGSNIQVSGTDESAVKIYYSENANATEDINNASNKWEENIANTSKVKKYAIVMDELQPSQEVDFAYNMNIPANLEYNMGVSENYKVSYITNETQKQSVEANTLSLKTGVGPEVTTTLTANVGSKDGQVAKEGEKIEYTITAKNTGSVEVSDVKLIGQVPEGTVYVEEFVLGGVEAEETSELEDCLQEQTNKKEVIFEGIKLEPGQEITKTYMVKVQKGTDKVTVSNKIEVQYGEAKKESNTVETEIETGNVEIDIISSTSAKDVMNAETICMYTISVKNISDKDLKNVKIILNAENATIKEIFNLENLESIEDSNAYTIKQLNNSEKVKLIITAKIDNITDVETKTGQIQPIAEVDREKYYANRKQFTINAFLLEIENISQNESQYVKAGDTVTYKIDVTNKGTKNVANIRLQDIISPQEEFSSIEVEGDQLIGSKYEISNSSRDYTTKLTITDSVDPNQTKSYYVTTQIEPTLANNKALEIKNIADLYAESTHLGQAETIHIIEPFEWNNDFSSEEPDGEQQGGEQQGGEQQGGEQQGGEQQGGEQQGGEQQGGEQQGGEQQGGEQQGGEQTKQTKLISGTAWLDENENGQRDSNEKLLNGITVKLFNTQTNQFQNNAKGEQIKTTTNENGMYTLSEVPQGSFMVVFEYDNAKYALTTYEKEGVASERNSKVISREMEIDGVQKTVAVTEEIPVKDEHISYINIGLKERKVYDMKLEKMITRVIVQNANGTETTQFPDSTLAKIDIHAKQLSSSNVVVEYKIRVTNEGETEGYIRKIQDYVSADYKFSSELNKDWYQDGSNIYNNSLANTKLAPGESKEVILTLTKQMTENNTGLITNVAEIAESYNEQGLKDADSTEGNRAKGEDDMASADLIISIKTGEVVATVLVVVAVITILGVGALVITKKLIKSDGI